MIALATTFVWPLLKGFFGVFMRFAISPGNWLVAGLAVAIAFGTGHHKGRVKERGIWQAKIESERRSQNIITNAHEALAIKDIEELRTELETSNAQINELLIQAEADANAARVCLGTDSLQRINKGRKGKP